MISARLTRCLSRPLGGSSRVSSLTLRKSSPNFQSPFILLRRWESTASSGKVNLTCVLKGGTFDDTFSIDNISNDQSINSLKALITKKGPPAIRGADTTKLAIYKTSVPPGEDTLRKVTYGQIEKGEISRLVPTSLIKQVFPNPASEHIHAIVQPLEGAITKRQTIDEAYPEGLPYQAPLPLLHTSGKKWDYQPHKDLHKTVARTLKSHYNAYLHGALDKNTVPVYLFLSGQGTGKSRNGMEFPRTLVECSSDPELKARMENAKVFQVTLENGTPLQPEEYDNPLGAIGSRMLCQFNPGKDLSEIRKKYFPPTPLEVFRSVAKHEATDFHKFTGILIVDGLQRFLRNNESSVTKNTAFYQAIVDIGGISLRSGGAMIVTCCTATVRLPVESHFATSGQSRKLLPMAPLKWPTVDGKRAFDDKPITKMLVEDCGGHARAVEILGDCVGSSPADYVHEFGATNLMEKVRDRLHEQYALALNIEYSEANAILRTILAQRQVHLKQKLPGTDKTVDQVCGPGLIRFERKSPGSLNGYLTAPYIWFWMLQDEFFQHLDKKSTIWTSCDYGMMAHYSGEPESPDKRESWENFEKFVADFRVILSTVFDEGSEIKFSDIHSGAELNGDMVIINRHLSRKIAAQCYCTKSSPDKSKGREDERAKPSDGGISIRGESKAVCLEHCNACIINGSSAKAGDYFLRLELPKDPSQNSQPIVHEVGQCKFSKFKGKITEEMFNEERDKAASENDFFMLYTTSRECTHSNLPPRSGIVNRLNWYKYFGPFAGRAYFYSTGTFADDEEDMQRWD